MEKLRFARFAALLARRSSLIASVVSSLATVASAIMFYYSLSYSRKSVEIALQQYQHSVEDKLSARYAFLGQDEEYLVLINDGPLIPNKITVRREPFFVFHDRVESAAGLGEELRTEKSLIKKLKGAGILTSVEQYYDMMGPVRESTVAGLNIGQESPVELSHSSNANAVNIASVLNGLFIVRWRFDYDLGAGRIGTEVMYFWVGGANTREDLSQLPWGEGVAKRISDSASSTVGFSGGPTQIPSCRDCPSSPYEAPARPLRRGGLTPNAMRRRG